MDEEFRAFSRPAMVITHEANPPAAREFTMNALRDFEARIASWLAAQVPFTTAVHIWLAAWQGQADARSDGADCRRVLDRAYNQGLTCVADFRATGRPQ